MYVKNMGVSVEYIESEPTKDICKSNWKKISMLGKTFVKNTLS